MYHLWVHPTHICFVSHQDSLSPSQQGFEDFYDYKVSAAEGFNKKRLFEILDTLEEASRDTMTTARAQLAKVGMWGGVG